MKHLTLADEIVVLMLDDTDGEIRPDCIAVAAVAIAGGILMELALLGRIDTDLQTLFVVDPSPVGDELLDAILQEVSAETEKKSSAWWIDRLSKRHGDLIDRVLARLVSAGILRSEERRFLWVFSRRAYPQVSGREDREAKGRLMAVLFNDEVPEPRDALLLGLAKSTDVLAAILTEEQLDKAAPRIEEVASLEEISRSVGLVASEIRSAMVSIMMAHYP
jgi:golgi phosphoprotein 3